jgi:hypothetical protein
MGMLCNKFYTWPTDVHSDLVYSLFILWWSESMLHRFTVAQLEQLLVSLGHLIDVGCSNGLLLLWILHRFKKMEFTDM